MLAEALAAALVGLAALWLVLHPLFETRRGLPPPAEPIDPEETPRGVALAALKEIDFDRETGKLSDTDYQFLKAKYTTQALEALREEEGASSDPVELFIAARSRPVASPGEPCCPTCGPRPEADAVYCSTCGLPLDPYSRPESAAPAESPPAPLVIRPPATARPPS